MLNEGDKAPAITVTASDGSTTDLAAPGGPLVLYFYPKDDTSGCTREAQDFTGAQKKFEKLGVRVIGVSKDSLQSHEKFRLKHGLTLALGSDPETKAARAWSIC